MDEPRSILRNKHRMHERVLKGYLYGLVRAHIGVAEKKIGVAEKKLGRPKKEKKADEEGKKAAEREKKSGRKRKKKRPLEDRPSLSPLVLPGKS